MAEPLHSDIVKVDGRLPEPAEVVNALKAGLRRGLNAARRRARALAPKGGPYVNQPRKVPGRMARSIYVRVTSQQQRVVGRIGSRLFYARFVEKGTAPHVIPKTLGKRMFFIGPDGEPVFAKVIQHPGAAARPFLAPAVQQSRQEIADEIEVELEFVAGTVGDASGAKAAQFFKRGGGLV